MEIKQKIEIILNKIDAIPMAMKQDSKAEAKNLLPLLVELHLLQYEEGFHSAYVEVGNIDVSKRILPIIQNNTSYLESKSKTLTSERRCEL